MPCRGTSSSYLYILRTDTILVGAAEQGIEFRRCRRPFWKWPLVFLDDDVANDGKLMASAGESLIYLD